MQEAYSLLLFPIALTIYVFVFCLLLILFLYIGVIFEGDHGSDNINNGDCDKQDRSGCAGKTCSIGQTDAQAKRRHDGEIANDRTNKTMDTTSSHQFIGKSNDKAKGAEEHYGNDRHACIGVIKG